ncbi:MAG: hypothetical protein ACJ8CN_12715 [Gemmatimonadales bacterium]
MSHRRERTTVRVNCAALPATLVENDCSAGRRARTRGPDEAGRPL